MNLEPILTICILHFRKLPQLKKTIFRLKKFTKTPFKIKLLNQQYVDRSIRKYLKKIDREPNIEVIYGKDNLGCPAGRYKLLQDIDTKYVLTLDDDIYVHKNWDKKVIETLDKNPQIGAITFVLYNPTGQIDSMAGRTVELDKKAKIVKMRGLPRKILKNRNDFIEVDDLSGGAMLFRKELLNDFNWDPNYFIGFGDLDKGMQLKKSKYKFYLYLRNHFVHDKVSKKRNQENKDYNKIRRDYQTIRKSYLYFVKKWGYHLPLPQRLFFCYFCLLPNSISSYIAHLWLNYLKPALYDPKK